MKEQKPHLFKKGQSGNPGGRKPMPEDVRELKTLRTEDFHRALYQYLGMPIAELKAKAATASELTWLELILIRAVERTSDSDWKAINDVLDRAFGKATQPIEASGPSGGPIVINWPNDSNPTT